MLRTLNVAEHNLYTDPPRIVAVAAATPTEVLPNEQNVRTGEIAYRYIQNTDANNDLYYSFGLSKADGTAQCDNVALYHGMLKPSGQLDCSNQRQRVCVYSVGGATVATVIIRRRDLSK
jgi:hypothetical protein